MNKDTGKRYATPAKNRETSKNRPVKGKKGEAFDAAYRRHWAPTRDIGRGLFPGRFSGTVPLRGYYIRKKGECYGETV